MNPEMIDAAEAAWNRATYQRTSRRAMAAAIAAAVDTLPAADGYVWCEGGTSDPTVPYVKYVRGPYRASAHRDCPGRHRRLLIGPAVPPDEEPTDG